jgi:hypothetical protein
MAGIDSAAFLMPVKRNAQHGRVGDKGLRKIAAEIGFGVGTCPGRAPARSRLESATTSTAAMGHPIKITPRAKPPSQPPKVAESQSDRTVACARAARNSGQQCGSGTVAEPEQRRR